jgi:hypothetical protein
MSSKLCFPSQGFWIRLTQKKFDAFLDGEHWLKDIDAHGLVYTDGEFGSLELDSSSLLYIAEQKKPKGSLLTQ